MPSRTNRRANAARRQTGRRANAMRSAAQMEAGRRTGAAGRNGAKTTGVAEMQDLNKKVKKIIRIIERIPVIIMVIKTAAESVRIARRNLKAN